MDLASWELSSDNSTLAGASLPGYTSPFARRARSSQGQPDIFYSSCASSQNYSFLKKQPSQLLKLRDHNTPLLWFIPDTSHLHQLCSPNWGILWINFWTHLSKAGDNTLGCAGCLPSLLSVPDMCFCPCLACAGLCLVLHGSTAHCPHSFAMTHARNSGTCEAGSRYPENIQVLLIWGHFCFW